jgi:hypothetical protein
LSGGNVERLCDVCEGEETGHGHIVSKSLDGRSNHP